VKQPFRSPRVGWVLKLTGVLYWLMMASPLSDGIGEFVERLHAGYFGNLAILLPLWAPAALLIYFGYRLCQQPFSAEAVLDEGRKPILFLRPFAEDARMSVQDDAGLSLQPGGLLPTWSGLRRSGNALEVWKSEWATEGGATGKFSFWNTVFACSAVRLVRMVFDRDVATAEETLARFFERHGQPFAIGKPGERFATPGAPRVYVKNALWQRTVSRAIKRAHAIVIQPGRTAGVRWELEQIRQMADPERVLLCMISFWKEPQAYEELTRLAREATGINLPRVVPFLRTPVFIYFQGKWKPERQTVSYRCPLLWPITGYAVDLYHCLRPFLRRIDALESKNTAIEPAGRGTDDYGLPRKPRWVQGSVTAVARFAGLAVALALMFAPVAGADFLFRKAWESFESAPVGSSQISLVGTSQISPAGSSQISLLDASWTTLNGRGAPYSLSIPASLVKGEPNGPSGEYFFKSPDNKYFVSVDVAPTPENPSNAIQRVVRVLRAQPIYSEVRLETTNGVEVAGVEWTEARVRLEVANGKGEIRQTMRVFSDHRGSILIATGEAIHADQSYAPITEKILASVKLEKAQGSLETITNLIAMKLTLIPAGTFLMGSPEGEGDTEEHPQHEVRITQPFYLGATEVTRGQFRLFVDETGYKTEAEKDGKGGYGWNEGSKSAEQNPRFTWQSPGFEQTDEHPVVNVSWNDAQEFITWLSQKEGKTYRLPTEAEWEYACRAGSRTAYFCGDDPEGLAAVANIADGTGKEKYPQRTWSIAARDGYVNTAPVGRFRSNAFGLYDMLGNVWEWCQDEHNGAYYKESPVDDPPGPSGAWYRVLRGGSWLDEPRLCRSANRAGRAPGDRNSVMGFRLAAVQSDR
jgi:formylglycine-generating enzyme required for sulfatase activity